MTTKASSVLRLSLLLFLVLGSGLLSCGQKGDLYLPQKAEPAPRDRG